MTDRQEEIFNHVRAFQETEGVPPSTREVARRFAFSQPAALKHLQALAAEGKLAKLADGKWGLETSQLARGSFPVFGAIPAGLPALREQEPEETVNIDPAVFGVRKPRPDHFWFLRVTGDSMTGANIFDGDLVALVRREPRPGDIIAALVDETMTTLKRFVRERGRTLLRAANPRYPDIVPRQLEAQGVVVGVVRRRIA